MKHIVCFGDSNTWGFVPKRTPPEMSTWRFPANVRWTGIMQSRLGADFSVAGEGLNGRTTAFEDPFAPHRNGLQAIDICMLSHMPADLVILMLGTNDVKEHFGMPAFAIAQGMCRLVERVQQGGYGPAGEAPAVLVVAPARLHEEIADGWLGEEFGEGAMAKDAKLAAAYRKIASACGAHFLDAGALITADPADGVHLNAQGHAALGEMMERAVREILG